VHRGELRGTAVLRVHSRGRSRRGAVVGPKSCERSRGTEVVRVQSRERSRKTEVAGTQSCERSRRGAVVEPKSSECSRENAAGRPKSQGRGHRKFGLRLQAKCWNLQGQNEGYLESGENFIHGGNGLGATLRPDPLKRVANQRR
jgi:hypothetical protein